MLKQLQEAPRRATLHKLLLLHKPQKKTILVLQAMYMPKVQPLLRKASPCHHCLFHTHTRKTESEV